MIFGIFLRSYGILAGFLLGYCHVFEWVNCLKVKDETARKYESGCLKCFSTMTGYVSTTESLS